MAKTHSCQLPKPDTQGRYRPVVGRLESGKPQRFQVGRVKDTTAAEAQRRLEYLRLLYEHQCRDENIDYWAGSMLPWAIRLASAMAASRPDGHGGDRVPGKNTKWMHEGLAPGCGPT